MATGMCIQESLLRKISHHSKDMLRTGSSRFYSRRSSSGSTGVGSQEIIELIRSMALPLRSLCILTHNAHDKWQVIWTYTNKIRSHLTCLFKKLKLEILATTLRRNVPKVATSEIHNDRLLFRLRASSLQSLVIDPWNYPLHFGRYFFLTIRFCARSDRNYSNDILHQGSDTKINSAISCIWGMAMHWLNTTDATSDVNTIFQWKADFNFKTGSSLSLFCIFIATIVLCQNS